MINEQQAQESSGHITEDLLDEMHENPESQKEMCDIALGFLQIAKGAWEIW